MVEDVDSVRESRCSPGKKRGSGNESGECRGERWRWNVLANVGKGTIESAKSRSLHGFKQSRPTANLNVDSKTIAKRDRGKHGWIERFNVAIGIYRVFEKKRYDPFLIIRQACDDNSISYSITYRWRLNENTFRKRFINSSNV